MRVHGRITRANVPINIKHPLITPWKGHLTQLLIGHHHLKVNHKGRGMMMHNELRQSGYWLIDGSPGVSRSISSCVTCRRLRRPTENQKMACLPEDRLEPAPPFYRFLAPFIVKERRSDVKRYRVLYVGEEVFTWRLPILWTVLSLLTHWTVSWIGEALWGIWGLIKDRISWGHKTHWRQYFIGNGWVEPTLYLE